MIPTNYILPKSVIPHIARSLQVWRIASIIACACIALTALQAVLFDGIDQTVQPDIAAAQFILPWLTWALLAPALWFLFETFPFNLSRPWTFLAIHAMGGIIIVALKLLVTAPLAALFIWRPLGVSWTDGINWLLAHRSGANLVMFWALLSAYTAYRYYQSGAQPRENSEPNRALDRLPVRAGDGTAFVALEHVTLIEADRNQTIVFAGNERHTTRATLRDLETRLSSNQFLRIHRARIINIAHVARIEPWGRGDYVIVMKNGGRVLSGKTYRSAVKQLLR
jgi:hypothetical protein